MDIFSVMQSRHCTRDFSSRAVSRQEVESVIRCAGLAPSAINLQPWAFVVTYGEEKERLIRRLNKARAERQVPCGPGTEAPLPEAFASRSRRASEAMKPLIARKGVPFNRFIEEGSCAFYGAPIAIIVTMDRLFPPIRYLDVGLSVSYLLLAAHARGLATCPIGLITAYAEEIADVLDIPAEKEILLGIALGYADPDSPLNALQTERAPLGDILNWYE